MTQPVVLVVGSLHYDIMVETDQLPRRDETAVGRRWYPKFGGKGGNQAVAAARAGARCRMFGAVGDDAFGGYLRAGLTAAGVDDRFVATVPGVGSGMSVAIQDSAGNYAATIVSGANLEGDQTVMSDARLWQDVGLLVLQNELPAAVNLQAAREARGRGITVLLNAAPARVLPPDLAALVDVLVVNAVEAETLSVEVVATLGSALDAARLLAVGVPTAIVTAGALGLAVASCTAGSFTVAAEAVPVVSTHGAGDAFIGTLAACLLEGEDLRTACGKASLAAARHVSAQPGLG